MAKRSRTRVTDDIKGLAAELGLPVQQGTVSAVGDRFYLTMGKTKLQIPVGELNSAADIGKLAGEEVPVIVSGKNVLALAYPLKKPWILCYVPVPDLIKKIAPEMRRALIKQYTAEGIMTKQVARRAGAAQRR